MDKQKIIDFMGLRKIALIVSAVLITLAIASLAIRGLNFGIDFTGGTEVQVQYPAAKHPDEVRTALEEAGFKAEVQHFGSARDILVRLPPLENLGGREPTAKEKAELSSKVLKALRTQDAKAVLGRVNFVGPKVGSELREQGGLAMLLALAGILIYVTLRFEFRFSVGAVAALVHDVIIVLGFFAITQIEFDLTVLAAILAVIGYSLNDTIVVFDRQRENFRILRDETSEGVLNISINQTLTRTLVTSLTTLLVVVTLYLLGSEIIAAFALALIVGIFIGTYSSIYVASNLLLVMGITKEALIPPEKDNSELDEIP